MTFTSKLLGTFAAVTFAGALGASAATLDFTDNGAYTTQSASLADGSFLGITWTVTPVPSDAAMTYSAYDGPGSVPLARENDGIGITDDEVTYPAEALTLTFSKSVIITGIHFLDLFFGDSGTESVKVFDGANNLLTEIFADDLFPADGGYHFEALKNIVAKTLVFWAGPQDDIGSGKTFKPDFALAAIDVKSSDGQTPDPVPLPAGGLLLLTALGGLGLMRKRGKL